MQPTTSRQFQKAAHQRLMAAEALLNARLTLDAQYLSGYTIECTLKALILHKTSTIDQVDQLQRITSGSAMHRPYVLLQILANEGVLFPSDLKRRLSRFTKLEKLTDLRYETGRPATGETKGLLKLAISIYDWVEDQLT